MRPALAISLYVTGRRVLLVGRGAGVVDRAARLEAAGAHVIRVHPANYDFGLCRGAFAVLAQSGDRDVDRRVAGDARAAGCLAYAHDQPEISDFAMPALVRRGPLSVAIATDGEAPALAGALRRELAALIDGAGDALDGLIERMRAARRAPATPERAHALRALAGRIRVRGQLVIDG